jgi:hypothetical protein
MMISGDNHGWRKWLDDTSITIGGYTITTYSDYSNYDVILVGASERFWGEWVDCIRYWELQAKLFIEQVAIWRHIVLKPFLAIGRSTPRINIFQPCWSHRRRHSITSKTRQRINL